MIRTSNSFHRIQAIIGVIFAVFVAYCAYDNFRDGRPDLTPGRIVLAITLVVYSLSQLWIAARRKVSVTQLLAFPIHYLIFGIVWEYASMGYRKNWAPDTAEEALHANIFFAALIILLVVSAGYLTFRKGKDNA